MQSLIRFLAASIIATTPFLGSAQEPSKPEPEEPFQTTLEMRDSAWKEFQKADEQLNKVFKNLLSQIESKTQKNKLREAQKAWLRYRDKNADFEASFYDGGSIRPQFLTGCMTAMTENRTKELQSIIDDNFGH